MAQPDRYISFFEEIGGDDIALVGGKNASLGEMYRKLTPQGLRIPNGFAVTAAAYRYVLDSADAWDTLRNALDGLDIGDVADLSRRAALARDIVYGAALPADLVDEILAAYAVLRKQYGDALTLAVRSSATAEDLPTASFAGQHDSFLNVADPAELLDAVRRCFASLFTDRAIRYRVDNGFDHFKVSLSVGMMKMVRADTASSGVMFTLDTETGFRDLILITAAYGLGENVVQGNVDPDEFHVFKPTFRSGHRAVLRRTLGAKQLRMVCSANPGGVATHNMQTTDAERRRFCIDDADVLTLAAAALQIEDHFSAAAGHLQPMDIEWAKDGLDGLVYILQARPETTASRRPQHRIVENGNYADAPALAGIMPPDRTRVIHLSTAFKYFLALLRAGI